MLKVRPAFSPFACACVLLFWANCLHANVSDDSRYLSVRSITVDDGLPSSSVNCVLQDRDGFVWLATWGGICRFDGTHLNCYQVKDGLPVTGYRCLIQLKNGDLLAGSEFEGLFRLDTDQWRRIPIEGSGHPRAGAGTTAFSMLEDSNGVVWVGTLDGVWRGEWKGDRLSLSESGLRGRVVRALRQTSDGAIWAGTNGYVHRLADGAWQDLELPARGRDRQVVNLAVEDQCLWACTNDGLYRLDPDAGNFVRFEHPFEDSRLRGLVRDPAGVLWVATRNWLYQEVDGCWYRYGMENGLVSDHLDPIMLDSDGNLWIPTFNDGVMILSTQPVTNYRHFADGVTRAVTCVFADMAGIEYVGTGRGLYARAENGWKTVHKPASPLNPIFSATRTPDGDLLVAGTRELVRYHKGEAVNLIEQMGLPEFATYHGAQHDNEGNTWLCTTSLGIIILGEDGWSRLSVENGGCPSNAIFASCKRQNGDLVFGSRDGYVFEFRDDVPVSVFPGERRIQVPIMALAEDDAGSLWIATVGEGLYKVSDGTMTQYTMADGLADNICNAVLTDGNLVYVGTNKGLSIFDGKEWRSFDKGDGLSSNEISGACLSMGQHGQLLVGTNRGLSILDTRNFSRKRGRVPTRILGVYSGQQELAGVQNPVLKPEEVDVRFRFAGLEFRNPDMLSYRYRMRPGDSKWTVTTSTMVEFRSLRPGPHQFQVQAKLGSGQWGERAVYRFSILPPIWYRSWFIGLVLILAVVSGGLLYKGMQYGLRVLVQFYQRNWFAHFRIHGVLGTGGMAVVYDAWNRNTGQRVALKVMQAGLIAKNRQEQFLSEGIISGRLRLSNVVRLLDHGLHNRVPWIEMERVHGQTLTALREKGRIDRLGACCIFRVLVEILGEIHGAGVIHRDLKPDNIMLPDSVLWQSADSPDQCCHAIRKYMRILDFGIARLVDSRTLTRLEFDSGTPIFKPPETYFGEGRNRVDVDYYAAGMILYYLLSGSLPYAHDEDPGQTVGALLYREPVPISICLPDLPENLVTLVMGMIAKDPDQRLTAPEEMLEQVDLILSG